ncbi:hypothetical protein PVAP13_9KG033400 [Panicum virgatum]|uniref:Uncharacterized protein n=1 Tax=Panicum virgatum TaxID=38727 RepID=A0A8T0NED9_PANVG|nr:hypothetical protein PVAP13_9KG033400 [Panicum virgatum]KAG2546562.1 hypothetical protein PVAP13_9KG033400 [Panicum virgatum]
MALCSDVTSPQSGMTAAPPRRLRVAARSRPPRLPRPHRIACSTARCRRLCLADRGRTPPSPPAPSRSTAPHQRLTLHCTSTSPGGCSSRPFPLPSGDASPPLQWSPNGSREIRQRRRSGASPTAAAAARTRWARSRTPCRLLNAHHVCCRNWCAVARVKIPRNTILLVSNVTVYPPALWTSRDEIKEVINKVGKEDDIREVSSDEMEFFLVHELWFTSLTQEQCKYPGALLGQVLFL